MNPNSAVPAFQLSGFKNVDEGAVNAVNEILVRHKHKMVEHARELMDVHVDLKQVHKREKGEIYEVHVRIKDKGKFFVSEVSDRNLLAAVDSGLNKVIKEMEHHNGKLKG